MAKTTSATEPVLFVLIGWSRRYDGTEAISGGHVHLKENPENNGEMEAFIRQDDGKFSCGAGKGKMREVVVNAVFLARNPSHNRYEVVAVYLRAEPSFDKDNWCTLRAEQAIVFPVGRRPTCPNWPAGQGMRRWARRNSSKGVAHSELLPIFALGLRGPVKGGKSSGTDMDPELSAFEGELKRRFIAHRKREGGLRAAKIRQVLRDGNGHLVCAVPNCGFDFLEIYGEVGRNYAIVHHTRPLSSLSKKGGTTSMSDLAIVCANCHAMVHRDGGCREIKSLILG